MNWLSELGHWVLGLVDLFLHLDKHLAGVITDFGSGTYAILTAIVFCETGLVVTPLLPGDSLLFAAGTFAGSGSLDLGLVMLLLSAAAIAGDTVNYWVGKTFGERLTRPGSRWVKKAHVEKTHAFFEKYGGKTIIFARFVPIVRTLAPFVAGFGSMTYGRFILYNVVGGIAWVVICTGAGYLFGGLEIVRKNFSLVVLAIIFLSVLPGVIEYMKHRRAKRSAREPATQ